MLTRTLQRRVPVQFFNETFFRPKTVLRLNPQNFHEQFAKIPEDATLIRRHRTKFYICRDSSVIGIYSPMMCLPLPMQVPPGGMQLSEYRQYLDANEHVMLIVTTKASTMVATVDKHGKAALGPKTFIALPDERTSIRQLPATAPFYRDFFGYLEENFAHIDSCSTFWLKKGDDNMWSRLVHRRRSDYEDSCRLNLEQDPRWIPTTPAMYFPKLYDYKKRALDEAGALRIMGEGEIALE